jgi:hypothetical protein
MAVQRVRLCIDIKHSLLHTSPIMQYGSTASQTMYRYRVLTKAYYTNQAVCSMAVQRVRLCIGTKYFPLHTSPIKQYGSTASQAMYRYKVYLLKTM